MKFWMTAAAAAALLAGTAQADDDRGFEIRLGVTAHDLADHVEDGPNVTAEVLFASPEFLDWAWQPRPFVYGSFNTNELTNFGAAGLAWDFDWTERLNFEFKTGLSYNDGVTDIDQNSAPDDPTRIRLATTRALMGSHWLFYKLQGAVAATSTPSMGSPRFSAWKRRLRSRAWAIIFSRLDSVIPG